MQVTSGQAMNKAFSVRGTDELVGAAGLPETQLWQRNQRLDNAIDRGSGTFFLSICIHVKKAVVKWVIVKWVIVNEHNRTTMKGLRP